MMRKLQKVIINVNFDLLSTEEKIRGCILILFNTDWVFLLTKCYVC